MEIDANSKNWGSVNGLPAANRTVGGSQSPVPPSDSFASSNALEGALKNTPDVRSDAVAHGRALANTEGYPDGDTVNQLSNLLAAHLQGRD